jgi:hypothetical protein
LETHPTLAGKHKPDKRDKKRWTLAGFSGWPWNTTPRMRCKNSRSIGKLLGRPSMSGSKCSSAIRVARLYRFKNMRPGNRWNKKLLEKKKNVH